jgi:hypothetical protein
MITLHVYDPSINQTISRTVPAIDNLGNLNHADVAFHARIVMGASLYSDIDAIKHEQNLVSLAIPEERKELFEKERPERREWVKLGVGYQFAGFPTEVLWYHGLGFDAAVIPIPRLEVFVDVSILFMQGKVSGSMEDPETSDPYAWANLRNKQILVGVGARYDLLPSERIALLPEGGFHLGVSASDVTVYGPGISDERHYRKVHPALWAGLQFRVRIAKRVWFLAGLRFENLFRVDAVYLVDEQDDGTENSSKIFELSQFRFAAVAMVCFSI